MRRGSKPNPTGSWVDDFKRSAQEVGREARRVVQKGKLGLEINALEGKMGEVIYELGERCLELHQRNELHHFELDDIFADLAELRREVEDKRKQVEGFIPSFPAAEEDEDFIGGEEDEESIPEGKRFCPECGSKVRDAAHFCSHCGSPL